MLNVEELCKKKNTTEIGSALAKRELFSSHTRPARWTASERLSLFSVLTFFDKLFLRFHTVFGVCYSFGALFEVYQKLVYEPSRNNWYTFGYVCVRACVPVCLRACGRGGLIAWLNYGLEYWKHRNSMCKWSNDGHARRMVLIHVPKFWWIARLNSAYQSRLRWPYWRTCLISSIRLHRKES